MMQVETWMLEPGDFSDCWDYVVRVRHAWGLETPTLFPVDGEKSIRTCRIWIEAHRVQNSTGWFRTTSPRTGDLVLLGERSRLNFHHVGVYIPGGVLHHLPEFTGFFPDRILHERYPNIEYWANSCHGL